MTAKNTRHMRDYAKCRAATPSIYAIENRYAPSRHKKHFLCPIISDDFENEIILIKDCKMI